MNEVRERASLDEKTVQKVAKGEVSPPRKFKKKRGANRNSTVEVKRWSDGVDERVATAVEMTGVSHTRLQVVDPTTVIIWNHSNATEPWPQLP